MYKVHNIMPGNGIKNVCDEIINLLFYRNAMTDIIFMKVFASNKANFLLHPYSS